MSRIAPVVSSNADSKVATTLAQLKASLGMVPNLYSTVANSAAALDGYLGLHKTLSRGRLTDRQREILSLAVGQENECQYCLSAHTQLSKSAGLSEADALKARSGDGDDPFEHALASFARAVVRERGDISNEELERARKAGIDDGLAIEIIANVALNTFTNYVNEVADTEIDFSEVQVKL
jgi:uncharacterized peroxidase-related enzyme